jgi:hypothetical protein
MLYIPAGNPLYPGEAMYSDVLLFIILAFVVYFVGLYGRTAGWWSYRIYVFGFTSVAGLLFAMGLMNFMFPFLSLWGKAVIAAGATIGAVVFSLLLLKVLSKKME